MLPYGKSTNLIFCTSRLQKFGVGKNEQLPLSASCTSWDDHRDFKSVRILNHQEISPFLFLSSASLAKTTVSLHTNYSDHNIKCAEACVLTCVLHTLLQKLRAHVPRGHRKPLIIKSTTLENSFTDLKIYIMKSQVVEKPSVIAEKGESCCPVILPVNENWMRAPRLRSIISQATKRIQK